MLDIEIESYKGILFVRLSGCLIRKNLNKLDDEVLRLIKKVGIKNIVFNLDNVREIDKYGENALIKSMNICRYNKGRMFICSKLKLSEKLRNVKKIRDEKVAINLINL